MHELWKLTGIPKSTLYRYVQQLAETGSLARKPGQGRPKTLIPTKQRHLGRLATAQKVLKLPRSFFRLLKKLGVEWAREHLRQSWNKTVFSDETTLQLFRNTTLTRYKLGEERPQLGTVKHSLRVHVWGAFCAQGTIGFHMFTENMNGELYRKILTENLFSNANKTLGRNWVFQQDNDPKHTARLTTTLLKERCAKVLDWPSYSPDLNPIENLWAILKRRVEKRVHRLVAKKKPVGLEVFQSIIRSEWEALDRNLLTSLVKSMKKRLELVIEKDGRKIKY